MAHEGFGTCRVEINGNVYDRMLSMNLKVSTQDRTPSGTIVLSWSGVQHYEEHRLVAPDFLAGAQGKIWLDGQLAATIRFDTRISKGSPKSYELTLNFRGNQSINIDSAAMHETGQWNNETPFEIIQSVLRPGTEMVDNSGGVDPLDRMILAAGEHVDNFGNRVARARGLTFYENPEGQWVLKKLREGVGSSVLPAEFRVVQRIVEWQSLSTLPGEFQPLAAGLSLLPVGGLTLGRDFTQWSVKHDIRSEFSEIDVEGNGIEKDEGGKWGKIINNILLADARARNAMKVDGRAMRVQVPAPQDQQTAQEVANFENDVRNQQSVQVTLKMSTWSDSGGNLWKLDDKWHVSIPIDTVDDTLTIQAIEFELTKDSRSASLVLVGQSGQGGVWSVFGGTQTAMDLTELARRQAEEAQKPKPVPPQTPTPTTQASG